MTTTTVYHGTTLAAARSIRRDGLIDQDGLMPFVTIHLTRAFIYVMFAICVDLHRRGLADQPEEAQRGCVVDLHVGEDRGYLRDALVPDPSNPGDYELTRCPPAWVHTLRVVDFSRRVPPPAKVTRLAQNAINDRKRRLQAQHSGEPCIQSQLAAFPI